jgi:hypothetical protein
MACSGCSLESPARIENSGPQPTTKEEFRETDPWRSDRLRRTIGRTRPCRRQAHTNRNRRAVPCAALLNLHLDNTTITTAETVPAGSFDPPGGTPPFTDLPEFCRVVGMITPVANSQIGFEVWMPTDWNGKFNSLGSGGSAGSIGYAALRASLLREYAAMATDNGHIGSNCLRGQV